MAGTSRASGLGAYEWCGDLVSPDQSRRAAALTRHLDLLEAAYGSEGLTGTVEDLLPAWSRPLPFKWSIEAYERHWLLFLRWREVAYEQWRTSGWVAARQFGNGLVSHLSSKPVSSSMSTELHDLIVERVRADHRCGDLGMWRLTRVLANGPGGARLRKRLLALGADEVESHRLRATFLTWTIEHPDVVLSHRTWRRWRRDLGKPLTEPMTAFQLCSLRMAEAAQVLLGLDPSSASDCLEGVEPGPAARILTAMGIGHHVLQTVELAEPSIAARAVAAMAPPDAAALLTALPPEAAGPLFPTEIAVMRRLTLNELLMRMPSMRPQVLGVQLNYLGTDVASRALASLDARTAARAVAEADPRRAAAALRALDASPNQSILALVPMRERRHLESMTDATHCPPMR